MKRQPLPLGLLASLVVSGATAIAVPHSDEVVDAPGYRPGSEVAGEFVKSLKSTRIAVLPGIIRTREKTIYTEATQKAAVEFLKLHHLGKPELRKLEMDVGPLDGKSQFDWFKSDRGRVGKIIQAQSGADYFLALEFLIPKNPSGEISIFGIHVFVLNAKGEDAFSFLLNSHHKVFNEPELKSEDSSAEGRTALVSKGTPVALEALLEQIGRAGK